MNGISALIRETPENSLVPFHHVRTQEEGPHQYCEEYISVVYKLPGLSYFYYNSPQGLRVPNSAQGERISCSAPRMRWESFHIVLILIFSPIYMNIYVHILIKGI